MELARKLYASDYYIHTLKPAKQGIFQSHSEDPQSPCLPSQKKSLANSTQITYFMAPERIISPETGEYKTYGIAAYHYLSALPVQVVRDISLDGSLVFAMVRLFNKYKLSPLHLKDVVLDMLG